MKYDKLLEYIKLQHPFCHKIVNVEIIDYDGDEIAEMGDMKVTTIFNSTVGPSTVKMIVKLKQYKDWLNVKSSIIILN